MREYDEARSGMIVGVAAGAFGALASGAFGAAGTIDLAWALLDERRLSMTGFMVAGGGLLGTILFGFMCLSVWKTLARWQRINEQSTTVWGTLGEPRRTNHRINRRHLYELPLTIHPPQAPPYTITASWFLPLDLREKARPGARVIVRLDPEDSRSALVDWEQTRATWGLPPPP